MAELHCWTVGGSLACDPMPRPPAHTDQQIQAFLHSIGFDHSWTPALCPSVETRRRNVSQVCFQFCLYSEEFGTNHYGHVKGMSDLSTFQFCNWFDNILGSFVNCRPLLRPIADGWLYAVWYWSISNCQEYPSSASTSLSGSCHRGFWFPGFSPRSWITISQEL